MPMNLSTKLVFALEHVAHLHDLIEGNEWEHHLNQSLTSFEYELKRQLRKEESRTGRQFTKWTKDG